MGEPEEPQVTFGRSDCRKRASEGLGATFAVHSSRYLLHCQHPRPVILRSQPSGKLARSSGLIAPRVSTFAGASKKRSTRPGRWLALQNGVLTLNPVSGYRIRLHHLRGARG